MTREQILEMNPTDAIEYLVKTYSFINTIKIYRPIGIFHSWKIVIEYKNNNEKVIDDCNRLLCSMKKLLDLIDREIGE